MPPERRPMVGFHPKSHLTGAILSTIFCCLPFGIVAIVYASQVGARAESGDYRGAMHASEKARMWVWIAAATGVIGSIIWFSVAVGASNRLATY